MEFFVSFSSFFSRTFSCSHPVKTVFGITYVNSEISEAANDSFSGKKTDTVIFISRGGPKNQLHLRWNSLRQ